MKSNSMPRSCFIHERKHVLHITILKTRSKSIPKFTIVMHVCTAVHSNQSQYFGPHFLISENQALHQAIDAGVSAAEMASFLERNAHPRMATQTPVLPETVVNQINLWARERRRVQAHDVFLYEQFASAEEFQQTEAKGTVLLNNADDLDNLGGRIVLGELII